MADLTAAALLWRDGGGGTFIVRCLWHIWLGLPHHKRRERRERGEGALCLSLSRRHEKKGTLTTTTDFLGKKITRARVIVVVVGGGKTAHSRIIICST